MGIIRQKITEVRSFFGEPEGMIKEQKFRKELWCCGIKIFDKDSDYNADIDTNGKKKITPGFKK